MLFSRALLVGASFVAAAFAQSTPPPIAFTTLPGAVVTAGKPVQLAWSGGDGSPVTITLKQGPSDALVTVEVITGDATGNSYTWTPDTSLPDASDYALAISQGVDDVNYTGEFELVGGATTTSTTMSSTTSAAATAIIIAGPSGNTTVTGSVVATTTLAGVGSSMGTGTALSRNTTFSSQTLGSSATTGGINAGPSATTTGSGSGTSTASATPTGAASNIGGSSLALVLCAVVGMFVLN